MGLSLSDPTASLMKPPKPKVDKVVIGILHGGPIDMANRAAAALVEVAASRVMDEPVAHLRDLHAEPNPGTTSRNRIGK
jgi:transcriptional regulator of aromatic amino acid metabolism